MNLKITDDLGAVVAEHKMNRGDLLFLISGDDSGSVVSVKLIDAPRGGELVYAVFRRRCFGLHCVPIRSSVSVEGKASIQAGTRLAIGTQKYIVSTARRRMSMWAVAIAVLLVGIALSPFALRWIMSNESTPEISEVREGSIVGSVPIDEAKVVTSLDVARRYIRDGSEQQAKMSLIEAVENDAGDESARRLLKAIDREPGLGSHNSFNQGDARRLFDDGLEMERRSDYVGALKSFDSALKEIGDGVPPSYFEVLVTARNGVRQRLKDDYAQDVKRVRQVMREVPKMSAPKAIEGLVKIQSKMRSITSVFPREQVYSSVKNGVELMIDSVAGAWMDGAVSAEYLSGCSRARAMYSKIARSLTSLRPNVARRAHDRALLCSKEVSR